LVDWSLRIGKGDVQVINWLDDVGAPALVTAANIGTRLSTTQIFGQRLSDMLPYGLAAVGYYAAVTGFGGKYSGFLKNVGIAAAPLAFEKLYNKVKGAPTSGMGRMSRYPAPAPETPFQGVRLV
jgi:hypothetical protein